MRKTTINLLLFFAIILQNQKLTAQQTNTITPITQKNIHAAVKAWNADPTAATATYGHIKDWDVSSVTSMSGLFTSFHNFNDDISDWDVSNVTNMNRMFTQARAFNQDISGWDVSNVTSMKEMFETAEAFNRDISGWVVSNVTNMEQMFMSTLVFNQDISGWDVSNVTNMKQMFREAKAFNQDISGWDVSNVTNMDQMFYLSRFTQNISNWCVEQISRLPAKFICYNNFSGFPPRCNRAKKNQFPKENYPIWGTCPVVVVTPSTSPNSATALNLDGTDDYIDIGQVIPSNVSYTKEAWIYLEKNTGFQNIISSNNAPFWINQGVLSSSNNFQGAAAINIASPNTLAINTWIHVAVTYDATTQTMKLYKNGVLVVTKSGVPSYINEEISIGAYIGKSILDGNMDEVRIWGTARTAAEIRGNKDNELVGNELGLIAYYNFNQGVVNGNNTLVTTLNDEQTNGKKHLGQLMRFTLTGLSSNWIDGLANGVITTGTSTNTAPRVPATALNLDGTDDYINIGQVIPSNLSYTKEAWIYLEKNTGFQNIISSNNAPFWINQGVLSSSNNFESGAAVGNIASPNKLAINTWIHVAVTYDATTQTMKLYKNGVLVVTKSGVPGYTKEEISVGAYKKVSVLDGNIDEVRIWGTARTAAEIIGNKDNELVGNELGLIVYYNFNQGFVNDNNTFVETLSNNKSNATSSTNGILNNFGLIGTSSNWTQASWK